MTGILEELSSLDVDVNICEDGNDGGCDHLCVHEGHKQYRCECHKGFVLSEDKFSCIREYLHTSSLSMVMTRKSHGHTMTFPSLCYGCSGTFP